jgi:hypothetical protein
MDAITQTPSQLVHAVLGTLQQKLKAQTVRILFTTWESDTAKYEGNNTHAVIPDNIKIICCLYFSYSLLLPSSLLSSLLSSSLSSSSVSPPPKNVFRGGRGQVKKIHLPFSKNLIPQDPP